MNKDLKGKNRNVFFSNSIPVNKMQNFAFKILVYLLLEAQLSKSNIAIIRP